MEAITQKSETVQAIFQMTVSGQNLDKNHEAKYVNELVNQFKEMNPILFERQKKERGAPIKYQLDELLKFDVFTTLTNVRSYRKREQLLSNNDEACNFLLNDKRPSRSTMNNFRLNNALLILEFDYFLNQWAVEKKLVTGDHIVIDSTKIKAYSNLYRTININGLIYLQDIIYNESFNKSKNSDWKKLKNYFYNDKLPEDMVDLIEEIYRNLNKEGIKILKNALYSDEKRDWTIGFIDYLLENYDGKHPVNLTDPESRKMRMKDDTVRYGYTLQVARDVKNGFVIANKVTQEKNDKKGFQNLILDIKMNLGFAPRFASLDNGYWGLGMMECALEHGVIPICPDLKDAMRINGTESDNIFHSCNMNFDPVKEVFGCRNLCELKLNPEDSEKEDKLVFKTEECCNCQFQEECAPKMFRKITMSAHPLFLENKKNFFAGREIGYYKYRGCFSEGYFGTLFHGNEYPHLRRRGLKKAEVDLKLECIAANIKIIMNHFEVCEL